MCGIRRGAIISLECSGERRTREWNKLGNQLIKMAIYKYINIYYYIVIKEEGSQHLPRAYKEENIYSDYFLMSYSLYL